MNATLARRTTPSIYSAILLAFIVLAFAMQATFVAALAGGELGTGAGAPLIGDQAARSVPCVNG